jgi:pimeloyl-ACP methyl ester carboxylesterase
MRFLKSLICLISLLSLYPCVSQALEARECRNLPLGDKFSVTECKLLIPSPKGLKAEIYVKAWIPADYTATTPVIVFLHGRGYTRGVDDPSPTMLEDMGLKDFLLRPEYRTQPQIILAPQDNFIQSDTRDAGQDYWVGADGRDWEKFLGEEMRTEVNAYLHLTPRKWKSVGVSMGAHGAMKLAYDHPDEYKAFASISPVFRSTLSEIGEGDYDVFVTPNGEIVNNMGSLFLQAANERTKISLPPHMIEVHRNDFFFNPESFPSLPQVWNYLETRENPPGSKVQISDLAGVAPGQGHGMGYWRDALPRALVWLISQD